MGWQQKGADGGQHGSHWVPKLIVFWSRGLDGSLMQHIGSQLGWHLVWLLRFVDTQQGSEGLQQTLKFRKIIILIPISPSSSFTWFVAHYTWNLDALRLLRGYLKENFENFLISELLPSKVKIFMRVHYICLQSCLRYFFNYWFF